MRNLFGRVIAAFWNRLRSRRSGAWLREKGLEIGFRVVDGQVTRQRVTIGVTERTTHVCTFGLTGTGKTSLIKKWVEADLANGVGFLAIDFHGDVTDFVLRAVNFLERNRREHLSDRLFF